MKRQMFPDCFFFCFAHFKMYSDNLKLALKLYSYVRWCCHEHNVDWFYICFISFCSLQLFFFLSKVCLKRPFINIHHFGHEERNITLNRWAKKVVKFNSRKLLRIITSIFLLKKGGDKLPFIQDRSGAHQMGSCF